MERAGHGKRDKNVTRVNRHTHISLKPQSKLKDIIPQVVWENVAIELVRIHPSTRPKLSDYEKVFESLKGMEPVLSDAQLVLEYAEEKGSRPFYLAFGRVDPMDEGDTLSYTPWSEWLGRDLVLEPAGWLLPERIVAACLHDMTVHGFTEEKIKENHQEMNKIFEELIRRREAGEEPEWINTFPELSMKDQLQRLEKWLRWEGFAKDYFGESESWFVDRFISKWACPYYCEIDRWTIKAALIDIAQHLIWVSEEL